MKFKELWRESIQSVLIESVTSRLDWSAKLKILVIDEIRSIKENE